MNQEYTEEELWSDIFAIVSQRHNEMHKDNDHIAESYDRIKSCIENEQNMLDCTVSEWSLAVEKEYISKRAAEAKSERVRQMESVIELATLAKSNYLPAYKDDVFSSDVAEMYRKIYNIVAAKFYAESDKLVFVEKTYVKIIRMLTEASDEAERKGIEIKMLETDIATARDRITELNARNELYRDRADAMLKLIKSKFNDDDRL